jgi:hypothetical protein
VAPQAQDFPDRFVRQGALLAHVIDLRTLVVHLVVSQETIDLVRRRTHHPERTRSGRSLGSTGSTGWVGGWPAPVPGRYRPVWVDGSDWWRWSPCSVRHWSLSTGRRCG